MKFNNKGYTIVELLTVSFILIIISGVVSGIIVSTLRGSARSRMVNVVSQNGNYALSVISSIVNTSTDVVHIDLGGGLVDSNCANSPQGPGIELERVDGGITRLTCESLNISSDSADVSNRSELLDGSTVKLKENSCSFTCRQTGPFSPIIIETNFTLIPEAVNPGVDTLEIPFTTQVLLRSYRNQ